MGKRVLVATSNPGKLRDLEGAAEAHGVTIVPIPNFSSLPAVVEDGVTFEANALKKAAMPPTTCTSSTATPKTKRTMPDCCAS
jgi:inosine/xanthosine triphosphate pyrophosphatase family protein